ncbi:MAG: hypothetical protein BHW39_01220 [Firmicutes bacterium CAG:552_39_19]|nr:MAG: hypothetical protein BHW39_01220 [Firmicutes bacterium CAG:552_39_19]
MDNSIFNWVLKIIIDISAVLSIWKSKNKIVHIIQECIYCVVIAVLPVLFISFFVVAINGSESVDIGIVIGLVSFLVVGTLVYYVISNRKEEKKIEDYFLLGALYIDEYKNNKLQIKKYKFILVAEVIHFLVLFIGVLWGMASLMEALGILSVDTFMLAFVIGLFVAYALFVYGKCEKKIRQRRKAILGVFISFVWLVVVCIRINHYWKDITQIGLEDMLILFFSAVFTIPTIYEWMKNIPAKLVEPHSERVYQRRDQILKEYSRAKDECKEFRIQFLDGLKESIRLIIFKWKNGEKKRIIKFFLYIFVTIVFMFVMIWLGNNLTMLMEELIECVKVWYVNLNYEIQEIFNKIFVLLFLLGIMLWAIFMAPSKYAVKGNRVEKIKFVVELVIFEIMFGVMAGMILFF